jgi:xylulokinase
MNDQIEIMRRMGSKVSQVRSSGGGARSQWWRQLQADIYNAEVVTINTSAGPAYGVAILAMVADGCYKNVAEACSAAIKVKTCTKPDKKSVAVYKKHYALFGKLYQHLKADFADIARVRPTC